MLNVVAVSASGQRPGPLWILGRTPDTNPYTCTPSISGTYVSPAASITDSGCAVWTLGSGTTPEIVILRNGSPATPVAKGSVIEYYMSVVYVKGTDGVTWYSWNGSDFDTFGTTDPSGGGAVPTGYFVSLSTNTPAGDDSRSCMTATSVTTPKRTFASAIACLGPGDTLYARGGTYNESIITSPSGTSWASKVRITNYPGETVWLAPTVANAGGRVIWFDCNCSYIEFDGINLDGRPAAVTGIWTSTNNGLNPHHIRIQNAEIIGGAQGAGANVQFGAHGADVAIGAIGSNEAINLTIHGGGLTECGSYTCASLAVYLIGPGNLVENCNMYDPSGAFVQIYSRGDPANNNIVRNNRMHDLSRVGDSSEVWGILVATGTNNQVYNNVIYNITYVGSNPVGDGAIAIAGTGTKVYNNTLYNNINSGIITGTGAVSADIRNNITYLSGVTNYSNSGTGTTHTNNLEGIDPVFVSTGSQNFRLQSTSPARDAGTPLGSVLTTDLEAIPRPQGPAWDIGAYEYH